MNPDGTNIVQRTHGSEECDEQNGVLASRAASSIFKRQVGDSLGSSQTEPITRGFNANLRNVKGKKCG